jgi:hypothetical protein
MARRLALTARRQFDMLPSRARYATHLFSRSPGSGWLGTIYWNRNGLPALRVLTAGDPG